MAPIKKAMTHRYVTEARTGALSPIFRKTQNPCQILGHHGGVCLLFTRKRSLNGKGCNDGF